MLLLLLLFLLLLFILLLFILLFILFILLCIYNIVFSNNPVFYNKPYNSYGVSEFKIKSNVFISYYEFIVILSNYFYIIKYIYI